MKSQELMTFENPVIGTIRGFLDEKGNPWFLSAQVCRCLGIKDSVSVIKQIKQRMSVVEDYYTSVGKVSNHPLTGVRKIVLDNGNFGKQQMTVINEQWLYELIFASRKQTAIVFRAWVTGEVLPALRKHGEYRMEGKLIRRSFTDTVKESGENERMHSFAYSSYSALINKSLGLPNKTNRESLSDEMLEKIAKKEDLVRCMIADGKKYGEIKAFILGE